MKKLILIGLLGLLIGSCTFAKTRALQFDKNSCGHTKIAQKICSMLPDYASNAGQYIGLRGLIDLGEDKLISFLSPDSDASERISRYEYSKLQSRFIAVGMLKTAGILPSEYEKRVMRSALAPKMGETPTSYYNRITVFLPKMIKDFSVGRGVQRKNMYIGNINQKSEDKNKPITTTDTKIDYSKISTSELIKMARGK